MKGEIEMAELKGTEKQVAWATAIRENLINKTKEEKEQWANRPAKNKEAQIKLVEGFDIFLEKLQNESSAVWFINNRNMLPLKVATEYMKNQINT